MRHESLLGKVTSAVGRAFSGLGRIQEKPPLNPMDFIPAEMKMLEKALKREIVYGDYNGAGDLVTAAFQARAERIRGLQAQEISGDKEIS